MASAASTPTGANADESSFVYLGGKIPIDASTLPNANLPIDPNMPDLKDDFDAFSSDGIFNGAYDDENVGAVADFNNMDDTINVSPIPTLRIHKNHPKDQILGDPKSAVQTRGKIQKASSAQQALVSYISKHNRTNHKDHQNYLLACFLSQEEPKNISQALQDESWVETMQEELLQFKLQKEEGIDYDEVFAPVARIEAIRLFLAFASYMEFTVYQMDVKSVFIYGTIEEEVYVHQPPGFVDPAYPNKVYKVIKALYGLHQHLRACLRHFSSFLMKMVFRKKSMCIEFEDCMHKRFQMSFMGELTFFLGLQVKQQPDGIFISQDKYVADILKKFDFWSIRTATTPIESNKPLVKDEDGKDVDVHVYRSMIGSLMDSPFELEAFSDNDYGGASLDRKSTTCGCQFLGRRLISWQCKKQTIVANSTTETEYVAAANYCGQSKANGLGKDFPNPFMAGSLPKTIKQSNDPPLSRGYTLGSGEDSLELKELMANCTEIICFVRKKNREIHLKLDDAEGISSLSNEEIFEHLAHMGYVTNSESLTFFKAMVKNLDSPHKFLLYPRFIQLLLNKQQRLLLPHTRTYPTPTLTSKLFSNMRRASKGYSGVVTPLFENMLVQAHDEEQHQSPSRITSTPSLSQQPTPSLLSPELIQPTHEVEETASMPYDSPLHVVHSHGSAESSVQQHDLTVLVTQLNDRIDGLEKDLLQTKKTYSTALTKLVLRVKKLESKLKSGKARRKVKIVLSDDEEIADDSFK
ncbi:putative ribonuclease H-like domain-containing protein [Tanacetum coccineum]